MNRQQQAARILGELHPRARGDFARLTERLFAAYDAGATKTLFVPLQGYRSPAAQAAALARKTSKAGPFASAHQFGLAVDFVPWRDGAEGQWTWDLSEDWDFLRAAADGTGLRCNITWDRPHVEHPLWSRVQGVFQV